MAVVRAMTGDDIDAMRRLAAATPEAPHWTQAVYEGFLSDESPGKRIFVAADDNQILGFAAAQVIADVCELDSVVVDASARRTGLAGSLLVALKDWARQRGAIRVELEVRDRNQTGISFYEHAGFRRDGLRRGYYRNPDGDAVLMSLSL